MIDDIIYTKFIICAGYLILIIFIHLDVNWIITPIKTIIEYIKLKKGSE